MTTTRRPATPHDDIVAGTQATELLRAQQRALARLVTARGEDVGAAVDDDAPWVAQVLRPLAGAPPRVSIYRTAFRARLVAALRTNLPVLHRVLGDDAFEALALGYLHAHPSRDPSIRWFGHALADWLDDREGAGEPAVPHPSLVDLARMEWALGLAFDAADAVPLAVADLAAVPPAEWPALRFAPHPSLRLVALRWAVEPLWKALTEDEDATTSPPEPLAHVLAVWRRGLDTRWRSLPQDEHEALAACLGGERFEALCARVGDAARVAGWLRGWVAQGLLLRGG